MNKRKYRIPKDEGSVTDIKKVIIDRINEMKVYGIEYVHYPTYVFSKTARTWYTNQNKEDPTLFREVDDVKAIPDMYFNVTYEEVEPIEKYGGSVDNAIASYGLYYDKSLAKQNINPYVYRPYKHEYVFNKKDKKWYHNPVASLTFVEVDEDDVPDSNFKEK